MTFKVINPGMFSTIQDRGRIGFQSEGFSQAGAVDDISHVVANQLLGNDLNAATLEMTFQGVSLKALEDTVIAVVGSDIQMTIDNKEYSSGRPIPIFKGENIYLGKCVNGIRAYLAVPGGFCVKSVLNSYSTHTRSGIGGFEGRAIKKNDILKTHGGNIKDKGKVLVPIDYSEIIRVIPGQQYHYFDENSLDDFFNTEYEITKDSDRMGMRLKGTSLTSKKGYDVLSEPTQLGSIQVPKDGQPIILLNDRQTAGGYARIATIALCDISKVAQMPPGTHIKFEKITVKEAAEEYEKLTKDIQNEKFLTDSNDFRGVRRGKAHKILKLMR